MSLVSRGVGLLMVSMGFLVMAGCDDAPRASVSGKVTVDGELVESGAISFVPTDPSKGNTAGATITNGVYQIEGNNLPSPGSYRVEITAMKKTGKKVPAGSPSPPGTMIDEAVESIPERFNKKSTLTQELKAGKNTCDYQLVSK